MVWGGNKTFLLEKTDKSSPAQADSPLRSQGAAVQRGGMAVHLPSPSELGEHPGIPTSPATGANLHSLYPSPCIPALAWPLSKLPQILWALCRGRVFSPCWDGHHSGGTCCMLVFSWEPSDHFREKIESLSRNTPR